MAATVSKFKSEGRRSCGTNTITESALKVNSGRKIPCCTRVVVVCVCVCGRGGGGQTRQYCAWLFSRTVYPLSYHGPQFVFSSFLLPILFYTSPSHPTFFFLSVNEMEQYPFREPAAGCPCVLCAAILRPGHGVPEGRHSAGRPRDPGSHQGLRQARPHGYVGEY